MATLTQKRDEHVIWMADCYDLAKRFPNPHTWLALLDPVDADDSGGFERVNAFHYWLWLEIWKAAQEPVDLEV